MQNKKQQNKTKQYVNQNTLESLTSVSKGVAGALNPKDFGKGLWEQVLNMGNEKRQGAKSKGELKEGQELDISSLSQREKAQKLEIEPGIDYRREILRGEERINKEQTHELSVKIQEIILELKQLMNVSQELKVEFKEIAVEPRIANPGKYHVSFFEWVLLIVKQARMKVEDSAAWLGAFKSKKAKKQYWSMFKKHGTTFGLSNERVVATQTG